MVWPEWMAGCVLVAVWLVLVGWVCLGVLVLFGIRGLSRSGLCLCSVCVCVRARGVGVVVLTVCVCVEWLCVRVICCVPGRAAAEERRGAGVQHLHCDSGRERGAGGLGSEDLPLPHTTASGHKLETDRHTYKQHTH